MRECNPRLARIGVARASRPWFGKVLRYGKDAQTTSGNRQFGDAAQVPRRISRLTVMQAGKPALPSASLPSRRQSEGAPQANRGSRRDRHFPAAHYRRTLSAMKSFYITTAIDYVNGSPHIGHAYEKVLTDVIARFRRLMGDPVFFLIGTDEHGQPRRPNSGRFTTVWGFPMTISSAPRKTGTSGSSARSCSASSTRAKSIGRNTAVSTARARNSSSRKRIVCRMGPGLRFLAR